MMILDKMRTSNQPIGFSVVAKLTMSQSNQAVVKLLEKIFQLLVAKSWF